MPRKHSLTRAELSALSHAQMRRVGGEYFLLTTAKFSGGKSAKMACVVSKKVAARAHARNTLKRRCRAIVRPLLLSIAPTALIFHAKREAPGASFTDLKRDIEKLIARIS